MKINEKVKVIVSEPWNFSSSDGENIFKCRIIDYNKYNDEIIYLADVSSKFNIDDKEINKIVLQPRNKNNNDYNIYYINEDYTKVFNSENIINNLRFIMIGSIKDNKKS